ncbi:hypothetical protein [Lelliottia sp. WAP21]|uniref:hypothetical protein n=1 Tax=Lelliottia sp. WAP21 TaxID=2877426 RepID=UPI001E4161A6|nr:hypothetical protein [Lelliottia sp. WAP21]
MQITNSAIHYNNAYEYTAGETIKPLSSSCNLIQENPQDSGISEGAESADNPTQPAEQTAEEKAAMQQAIMSIMVAQYRVEVLLGGDPTEENNPMYVPEW